MKILILFIGLLAAVVAISQGASTDVLLNWDAPTTRTDGSPLPVSEILGYEVERTSGKTATVTGTNHTFSYSRLTESGSQSCSVRVRATDGGDEVLVSTPVTESFVIPSLFSQPSPASNLTITVGS